MWTCNKCGEQHDDQFGSCWKCAGAASSTASASASEAKTAGALRCLRCSTALEYVGTKKFHEGTNWGLIGELGELFVNRERFDVYACPKCGRVEFFVDGIGDESRPE